MLENAIADWLDGLSERQLYEPLLALLRAQGFHDVHLVHGTGELGRDVIGKRVDDGTLRQYGVQAKVGDVNSKAWREARLQIDSIRTGGFSHPSFDEKLPRAARLVTSGRLVGDAKLEAQAYRKQYEGEIDFDVWDRDRLVEMIVSSPSAALAGRDSGPLLAALGAADANELDDRGVERFARRWIPEEGERVQGADVLEAAVLAGRLAGAERLDLACLLALGLLRAATVGAWREGETELEREIWRHAAIALFVSYAEELWARCDEELLKPVPFVNRHDEFGFFATYPVRCLRTVELLSLLALWQDEQTDADARPLRDWIVRFVEGQPGAAHPISDRFAVSLLAPAVLLGDDRDRAGAWLREVLLWIADRYERPLLGLAPVDADPVSEVSYLLSALEHVDVTRRRDSYLSTVLLDLLAALRLDQLYADAHNELLAVDALPRLLHLPDSAEALLPDGDGIEIEVGVPYAEELGDDGWSAAHQRVEGPSGLASPTGLWIALACSSVLRDRHWPGVVRRMLEAGDGAPSGHPRG